MQWTASIRDSPQIFTITVIMSPWDSVPRSIEWFRRISMVWLQRKITYWQKTWFPGYISLQLSPFACLATLPPRLSFQWESFAPMGTARACAVAEALGGELYVTCTIWMQYLFFLHGPENAESGLFESLRDECRPQDREEEAGLVGPTKSRMGSNLAVLGLMLGRTGASLGLTLAPTSAQLEPNWGPTCCNLGKFGRNLGLTCATGSGVGAEVGPKTGPVWNWS